MTLTDLQVCRRGYVATFPSGEYGHLDLYIPAYAAGLGKEPDPPALAFVLQVWDEGDRRRLLDQPGTFEGACLVQKGIREVQVSREPGEIEEWALEGLRQRYPGIRLGNVWVLTCGHGSTPTAERVRSAWQYGMAELLIGAAVLGWWGVLAWRRVGRQVAPPTSGLL